MKDQARVARPEGVFAMGQEFERTSVILPTYNRSALLTETLDSLLGQSLAPAEIIVLDDGSTDDTAVRLKPYEDRVRYIQKPNSGKADSLNRYLKEAQHPLIWIMDDDDLAQPNALAAMTRVISGRPEIGFAYGRYQRFSVDQAGRRRVWDSGYWRDVENGEFFQAILEDFFVHHPGLLVRKTAYEAAGPFQPQYTRSEDYAMMIRLARLFPCAKTDEIVFLQRQHDGERFGGLAADKRNERWIEEAREMFIEVRETLSLSEYLPRTQRPDGPLSPRTERQALIFRGAIMARHKLWDHAFEDLEAACAVLGAQGALSAEEVGAIRRSLFSKFGAPELLDDPTIGQRLVALGKRGPVGRAIAQAFARALIYFIRTRLLAGSLEEASRYGLLAASLMSKAAGRL
jgi:hypothetical protein